MTREEFEGLHPGQILHHVSYKNVDGTPQRWCVNGRMQGSLKTGSARWPLKYGMYFYDYLRLNDLTWLVVPKETKCCSEGRKVTRRRS